MLFKRIISSLVLFASLFTVFLVACNTADTAKNDTEVENLGPQYATEFISVELSSEDSPAFQLAVQACVGLNNRTLGGSVYLQMDQKDEDWLTELDLVPTELVSASDFLSTCQAAFPNCVRYSYDTQQELLPSILTMASVLDSIPMAEELNTPCERTSFDATTEFLSLNTPELATQYVFENHAEETTGLAMLNPGYDRHAEDLSNPGLIGDMSSTMVDLVFSKRLFLTFLNNACVGGHPENELFDEIVNAGNWPTPIGVYGYNDSWLIGGYLYEAQTRCLESRNMGAIPTKTNNLSFFSTRRPGIEEDDILVQNDPEDITYDPSKTYVSFVVGDGDNINFIMSTRNVWLRQRLDSCEESEEACVPITWSISPHLTHIAPDVLEWYYALSHQTGNDYFTLPPSGHLYAYPSSLNEADQDRFVNATEQDARRLDLNTTVHWEWLDSWSAAEEHFLPKYARADGVIKAVFPVNVPYSVEAFPSWPDDKFFQVLTGEGGGELVLFRPRQWRGINDNDDPFFLSPENMAEELGNYPLGTVTGVYMTSDGGLNLENAFLEMVQLLPPHVELVSADTAARLAIESNAD